MELFCKNGIEETSIDEIAARTGVGSATIYGYYETKAGLAIRAGVAYWERIDREYLSVGEISGYQEMTGAGQLKCIMDRLVLIFEKETAFLKYLQEFDVFVCRDGIDEEKLAEYEACIMSLKPRVTDALDKGRRDGSLYFEWTPEEVCYSLAHTVFGVMKRFAWNGSMLKLDRKVSLVLQVRIAIELLMNGLNANGLRVNGLSAQSGGTEPVRYDEPDQPEEKVEEKTDVQSI